MYFELLHKSHSGEVYSIQHYVIKFVCDLVWFSVGTPVSSTNKTDCCDITEILLKVVLNTLTLTPNIDDHEILRFQSGRNMIISQ